SVENTTSPSGGTDRIASLGGTAQYGRQRPWPLVHRPEQGPFCWAFQRLLQVARSPNLGRNALAQLLEPPCTDPYARWCGRRGAERLPPIPIVGPTRTTTALQHCGGNRRIGGRIRTIGLLPTQSSCYRDRA